jgi:phosphopantothenate-cysteine ligase
VENYFEGKIRSNDMFNIKLKQLPKLISRVDEWLCDAGKDRAKLVGFKLLVNSKDYELIDAAKRSLKDNGCDMVVANDLQEIKDNNHKIHLVFYDKVLHYNTDPNDPNFLAKMVVKHCIEL